MRGVQAQLENRIGRFLCRLQKEADELVAIAIASISTARRKSPDEAANCRSGGN
jgi:hypothetical protein